MAASCWSVEAKLVQETEKAVQIEFECPDGETVETWVPKSCIESDDWDRQATLHQLRECQRENSDLRLSDDGCGFEDVYYPVDIQIWWLQQQDWFDEDWI